MREQPGGSAYDMAMLDAEDGQKMLVQKMLGQKMLVQKDFLEDGGIKPLMNTHGSLIERSQVRSLNK
jgi:hypothetical protein